MSSDTGDQDPSVETDEGVAPDLTGVGPREDDQTVTAEDLIELKDDPEPGEPTD